MENTDKAQAIKEWNEARFNNAIYAMIEKLAALTDDGSSSEIITHLHKAFYAYLVKYEVKVSTTDEKGEIVTDDTSYWINSTIETLSGVMKNISTLDAACLHVKGVSFMRWIEQHLKESDKDVADKWTEYLKR